MTAPTFGIMFQNRNAPSLLIEGAFGPPVVEPQTIETLIRQGQGTFDLPQFRTLKPKLL
ncbi:hypothetical protein [Rhizobium sp. CCGE 510]|uniref:hypothetical protein n=1 Tax=Rhizobium sp. CCGE 510 TaxID=1132836 RepID=UPI0002D5921E|nr:hypothetical protein [Rhizobium sp. CCGE 510]